MTRLLDYKDITILPRRKSTLLHRDEATTGGVFFGQTFRLPLIASPMPDVCEGYMAGTLARQGLLGIIHRFMSIENQVAEFQEACMIAGIVKSPNVACAIGAVDSELKERFARLHGAGCRIFCIDTANGFHVQVETAVRWIKEHAPNYDSPTYIIAGNVATKEGFAFLQDLGVDAIRVGIAGGSVCTTRLETGVYMPMVSSVMECAEVADKAILIADGGIKEPGDMNKAFAIGADMVMAGGIFAGTKESPGMVIRDRNTGQKVKLYRGAASFSVQKEHKGSKPKYSEGDESFVPYKGEVEDVVNRFIGGLQSCMSYCDSRNLKEFPTKVTIGYL